MQNSVPRVIANAAALALMHTLRAKHGPILFFQSGGCCDGSSPMCYPASDFIVADTDVLLGKFDDIPFYMSCQQYEHWKHTQLSLEVVAGNGGMFSLENGSGQRFFIRSRLFNEQERNDMANAPPSSCAMPAPKHS
jgi:uncharacterized protein (DUF779 family)